MAEYQHGMLPPEVEQGVRRQFGILDAASRTEEGGAVLARKTANRRLREIQDRHRSNPTCIAASWTFSMIGMLPGVGQAIGVNEAKHLNEQGSPVQAGILGALSLIPGGRSAKKPAEAALEAVTREISELAPRYQQLFGKQFVSPRAPEGAPIDAVLKGEQQVLDELRSAVTGKEAQIASKPGMLTTPKITHYDREGEMTELLGQAKANPYTQAIPGRQGLPSKAEQEKLIKSFYDAGGKIPAGPWGRDPADYQKAVQGGFEAARQEVQQLKTAKASARSPAEFAALESKLNAAEARADSLGQVVARLQKIIMGDGN